MPVECHLGAFEIFLVVVPFEVAILCWNLSQQSLSVAYSPLDSTRNGQKAIASSEVGFVGSQSGFGSLFLGEDFLRFLIGP